MSLFKSLINRYYNSVLKVSNKYKLQSFLSNTSKSSFSTGPNKASTFKLSLIGASVGALVGTSYSLHKLNQPNTHIANVENIIPVLESTPDIKPSRKISIPNDCSGLKVTLYQYQNCPFCCKVRAFLDYYGISYDIIEVDPVLRQSIRWSEYKKVPILLAEVTNGSQQLNDSTMIISALSSYLSDTSKTLPDIVKYYPVIKYSETDGTVKSEIMNRYFLMLDGSVANNRTAEDITEERKWRKWADDVLVHMLSPNVYRSQQEALQAFNWFSDVGEWERLFPKWEKLLIVHAGAFAMWLIGKRLKARYNLKDDVRESLYDECNYWMKALNKKGTQFMGGSKPNLSDLAVYGVLSSIEGCDAFQDLLKHSSISKWYWPMKELVTSHEGMRHL